jgi:amylosucrase
MIQIRKANPLFAAQEFELVSLGSQHLFAFKRKMGDKTLLVIANMSEHLVSLKHLPLGQSLSQLIGQDTAINLLNKELLDLPSLRLIEPLDILWLVNN